MKTNLYLQQYQQMPKKNCRMFKEECMAYFSWSEPTFYNKIKHGNLRPNEERDLAKLIAKYLTNSLNYGK